jgi:hypothetical protein
MMKSAETRSRGDAGGRVRLRYDVSSLRCAADYFMNSFFVVVLDVLPEKSTEMRLTKHDHVVEQIALHRPDPALGGSIFPGRPRTGLFRFDPEARNRLVDAIREYRIVVAD